MTEKVIIVNVWLKKTSVAGNLTIQLSLIITFT